MRFSTVAAVALAAAPVVVSAKGTLGFALGDKISVNGQTVCKEQADYDADLKALPAGTKLVRTYSASDCDSTAKLLPAAKANQFQVIVGMW